MKKLMKSLVWVLLGIVLGGVALGVFVFFENSNTLNIAGIDIIGKSFDFSSEYDPSHKGKLTISDGELVNDGACWIIKTPKMKIAVKKLAVANNFYQAFYGDLNDTQLTGCVFETRVPMESLLKNGVHKELPFLNMISIYSSNNKFQEVLTLY